MTKTAALLAFLLVLPCPVHAQRVQTAGAGVVATYDLSPEVTVGGPSFSVKVGATLVSFDGVNVDGELITSSQIPEEFRSWFSNALRGAPGSHLIVTVGFYVDGSLTREHRGSAEAGGFIVPALSVLGDADGYEGLLPMDRIRNKAREYYDEGRVALRVHSISWGGAYMSGQLATDWQAWLVKRRSGGLAARPLGRRPRSHTSAR